MMLRTREITSKTSIKIGSTCDFVFIPASIYVYTVGETSYFWANSSLVYTSGYWDLWNARSKSSSCSPVNVVRLRRCFRFKWKPGSDSVSESSALLGPLNKKQKKRVFFLKQLRLSARVRSGGKKINTKRDCTHIYVRTRVRSLTGHIYYIIFQITKRSP